MAVSNISSNISIVSLLVLTFLGIDEIVSAIGAGTSSSNAHAPNENITVDNYYKAIEHALKFYEEFERIK
ncbi:hypothetical protein [Sulfolobus acidocaldarius]|uniref:hypothetical protein n=1 Tax=Sulfolobus acidocaldarius TaxID=2285 RepID=UPI000B5ABBD8|nr:hypothetical protein [Sulfolobus acidocaldarius]